MVKGQFVMVNLYENKDWETETQSYMRFPQDEYNSKKIKKGSSVKDMELNVGKENVWGWKEVGTRTNIKKYKRNKLWKLRIWLQFEFWQLNKFKKNKRL